MKRIVLMAALLAGSICAPAFAQTTIVDTNAGTAAISTDLSNLCPNQVVYEKRCLAPQYVVQQAAPACAAPMVVESKRSHFLRFGLGPILDLGLL
jgi:hypothetical protein